MKNFLILTTVIFAVVFIYISNSFKETPVSNGIYSGDKITYSPSGNFFSKEGVTEDRIVLTKNTSAGSGSYSEYYEGSNLIITLGSSFEFIKDGRMIAVHNAELAFYEVIYENGHFVEKELDEMQIQELFPNTKIIKISEFKNRVVSIRKWPFQKREVLLLNDTEGYFHKYRYNPENVKISDITALIKISKYGNIEFSHLGGDSEINPKFVIKVKMF